jgi:hypothetical protein
VCLIFAMNISVELLNLCCNNPEFIFFHRLFEEYFFVFKDVFLKILSLCMISIQEWLPK